MHCVGGNGHGLAPTPIGVFPFPPHEPPFDRDTATLARVDVDILRLVSVDVHVEEMGLFLVIALVDTLGRVAFLLSVDRLVYPPPRTLRHA